jgi:hypothetical protein
VRPEPTSGRELISWTKNTTEDRLRNFREFTLCYNNSLSSYLYGCYGNFYGLLRWNVTFCVTNSFIHFYPRIITFSTSKNLLKFCVTCLNYCQLNFIWIDVITAVIMKSPMFSQLWLWRVLCSHSFDYEEPYVLTALIMKSPMFSQRWLWRALCSHSFDYEEPYVLTAVIMKSSIIWDVTPCSPVEANRCFGEIYFPHLQGVSVSQGSIQNEARNNFASYALRSWR